MPNFEWWDGRSSTQALYHFDGNKNDSSLFNRNLTGTGVISTDVSKFGIGSLLIPNTTSLVYTSGFDFNMYGQWTIDFWMRCTDPGATTISTIFQCMNGDGTQGINFYYVRWSDDNYVFSYTTATNTYYGLISTLPFNNQWNHIAIVKTSTTNISLFFNGFNDGWEDPTISNVAIAGVPAAATHFSIGQLWTYTYPFSIPINQPSTGSFPAEYDEFRISSTARWMPIIPPYEHEPASFTPPTAAYLY